MLKIRMSNNLKHQKLSKFGKIPLMPHTIFLQPMTGRRLKKRSCQLFSETPVLVATNQKISH